MRVESVRKMTPPEVRARLRAEYLEVVDQQRMTVRCQCGWYMRNILVGDGKAAFRSHHEAKH